MKLTVDLFINVLASNKIQIQGGTIHNLLKLCRVEYFDGLVLIIMNHNGKDIYIGGNYKYYNSEWIELLPLEEIEFIIYQNDLYYREEELSDWKIR